MTWGKMSIFIWLRATGPPPDEDKLTRPRKEEAG
jgi:hypothetical protein